MNSQSHNRRAPFTSYLEMCIIYSGTFERFFNVGNVYIHVCVCVLVVGRNPRWDIGLFPSNLVVHVGPGEEPIVVLGIY